MIIKGYKKYTINRDGTVTNTKSGRTVKHHKLASGYMNVTLSKNGKMKSHRVHRLVAIAYLPNPHNKFTVNHKDLNKQNNHVNNLEWMTQKENHNHARKNGVKFNSF